MTHGRRPIPATPLRLAALGGLLLLVAAAALAVFQRHTVIAELEQESIVLHRLASQRADQHDAHMTALSAIAVAADGARHDLFLDVAATIARFYPRIDEVQLVPLGRDGIAGTEPLDPETADLIRAAARASDGDIALLPRPGKPDHYMMVKRSPNSEAATHALMPGIDAGKLLGEAGAFWSRPGAAMGLSMPDGRPLIAYGLAPATIRFAKPLGSASQPLLLQTGMEIGPADLFPPAATAARLLAVTLAYLAALALLRQRAGARAAMEQARLSALDSRLAHASRVNALGEMASGLAHELTQPPTAILAQSQAGRRLARGEVAALAPILDDTVTQARRASAMLGRFRNWSRPRQAPVSSFDLREAIANVRALLAPRAGRQGARLLIDLPDAPGAGQRRCGRDGAGRLQPSAQRHRGGGRGGRADFRQPAAAGGPGGAGGRRQRPRHRRGPAPTPVHPLHHHAQRRHRTGAGAEPAPGRTRRRRDRAGRKRGGRDLPRHPAPQPGPGTRTMSRPAPLADDGKGPRRSHDPLPGPTEPVGNRSAPAMAEPNAGFHVTPCRNPKSAP